MEEVPILINQAAEDCIDLPPGFRFHPTDEEIITHYLSKKIPNIKFCAIAIGEVDLNKCEPWDLPNRKYATGMRTNRATIASYWKATGKDKEIYKGKGCLVGMKKTLVFYTCRAPKGEKTNWVMHEFRLDGKFSHYNLPKTTKNLLIPNYNYNMMNQQVMTMNQLPSSNATPNSSIVAANTNAIPRFSDSSNFMPQQARLRSLADQTNQKFDQMKRLNDYDHFSRDTGWSNDVNVEISSVQHDMAAENNGYGEHISHQQRHMYLDDIN
ncbi:hypothetical protein MKX03_015383 [Papaver bracteatum]|nr:hypothetical protein MKX03_015383 [Papaver bracteatum]